MHDLNKQRVGGETCGWMDTAVGSNGAIAITVSSILNLDGGMLE